MATPLNKGSIAATRTAGLDYQNVKVSGGPIGAFSALADALGFLHNDGAGVLAWSPEVGPDHAMLSTLHTDSLAAAVARGSLICGNATPKWAAMAVGAAGSLLTADGTDVAWSLSPQIGSNAAGGTLSINPTLGPELLTNGGFPTDLTAWTPGAAWQWSADGAQKFQDGVTTLAHTVATCVVDSWYKLVFTIRNWTVGTCYVSVGGTRTVAYGANGTYTAYLKAGTTASVIFVPTSTSRFTIDDVSLKLVTLGTLDVFDLDLQGDIRMNARGKTANPTGQVVFRVGQAGGSWAEPRLSVLNESGANTILMSINQVDAASLTASNSILLGSVHGILATGYQLGSAMPIAWSSTTAYSGAKDFGISRLSAGVGAVGNGTVGDFSGGLKMTTFGLGVTPVGVQTGAAVATDLPTVITLANALRAAAIAFGAITTV